MFDVPAFAALRSDGRSDDGDEMMDDKKYRRGDLVTYEVVGGTVICTVLTVGPRLMQIEMADGTKRLVHPRSVKPYMEAQQK